MDRRVTARLLGKYRSHLPEALVQRALVEAREAATQTEWPLLVFPILAEEVVARMLRVVGAEPVVLAQAA